MNCAECERSLTDDDLVRFGKCEECRISFKGEPKTFDQMLIEIVVTHLERNGGNRVHTARSLKMPLRNLLRWINKFKDKIESGKLGRRKITRSKE